MISQLELLLNYSNRFYNRQFLTQKATNHDLLTQLETLLEAYFDQSNGMNKGLPTVQFLADHLNVSPGYLSDVLRNFTGLKTQQHIHQKLIEKAKEYLSTDKLTVADGSSPMPRFILPGSISTVRRLPSTDQSS